MKYLLLKHNNKVYSFKILLPVNRYGIELWINFYKYSFTFIL